MSLPIVIYYRYSEIAPADTDTYIMLLCVKELKNVAVS